MNCYILFSKFRERERERERDQKLKKSFLFNLDLCIYRVIPNLCDKLKGVLDFVKLNNFC